MPLLALADRLASLDMHKVFFVDYPVINNVGFLQVVQRQPELTAKVLELLRPAAAELFELRHLDGKRRGMPHEVEV